jgi:hypothetical protein
MYTQKFDSIIDRLRKLDGGLSKLKEAVQCVEAMRVELDGKEKVLAVYTDEANAVLRRVRNSLLHFSLYLI